jgi:hypothetical protein
VPLPTFRLAAIARVDNLASNLNRNNSRSFRMDSLSAAISTS